MKKRVLITGTTSGIGRATAIKFLNCGYEVVGFDIRKSSIESYNYTHYVIDVSRPDTFPTLEPFNIVINNAGTLDEHRVIDPTAIVVSKNDVPIASDANYDTGDNSNTGDQSNWFQRIFGRRNE